ncbi:putative ABC transport system permease protein [Crossiella equi]|uniref:ABC transport system permease protein n=1 Tax=Crossiella equi TaxID=130796 RepID=A0ABS5A8M5_9PSEU|nr:ABC transporter permease [Crossiella equi]MBP2472607.1 putative ABC transport system permease protein [Crossiella equi]
MFSFAWQTIRARKAGFAAAFLALFGGAVLLTACGVLMESGLFGGVPVRRYAAAPVVVSADRAIAVAREEKPDRGEDVSEQVPLPVSLVDRLAGVPGVTDVVGEVSFAATVGEQAALGHGWGSARLSPYTLREGSEPRTATDVVLDTGLAAEAGLRPGQRVKIMVDRAPVEYRITGLAQAPVPGPAAFFTDAAARALSGRPDQVAAIGVFGPARVADAVRERFPDLVVRTGADRGEAEALSGAGSRVLLLALSGSFSGFVLMIVVFVTASTLALVLSQRRRELALLRAIAATPRQLRRLLGSETLIVSVAAAALGVVPGLLIADSLRGFLVTIGFLTPDFTLHYSPVPPLAAFLLLGGAAQLATLSAARKALRAKPVEALAESTVEPAGLGRGRVVTGWVLLVVAVAGAVSTAFIPGEPAVVPATMSALVAIIALGLLGPVVTAAATRLFARRALRSGDAARFLAAHNGIAHSRRLAASVTPLVLTMGFAITHFYGGTTSAEAAQAQARAATVADHVLTSPHGLPAEVADKVRALPGTRAATPVVSTEVVALDRAATEEPLSRSRAVGVDASQLGGTLDVRVTGGNLAELTGDTVALSEREAWWLGTRLGEEVELYLGDRTLVKLRLVALVEPNLGLGDVLLPHTLVLPHTSDRRVDSVLVAGNPDLSGLGYPGLTARSKAELTVAPDPQQEANLWLNRVLLGVILLYVALSVVNSLVTATLDRGAELGLLRLLGGTKSQLRTMLRAESRLIVTLAVVLGSLVPVLPLALLSLNLTGTPVPAGSPLVYLGVLLLTVLIGLLSVRLPARRLTR